MYIYFFTRVGQSVMHHLIFGTFFCKFKSLIKKTPISFYENYGLVSIFHCWFLVIHGLTSWCGSVVDLRALITATLENGCKKSI